MNIKKAIIVAILSSIMSTLLVFVADADVVYGNSPVRGQHLEMIKSLFSDYRINDGDISLDKTGRVILTGGYKDSNEVSLAFSLCQSVVGVKWVSPVTPEHIKVKDWEKKLSSLFPKTKKTPATEHPTNKIRGASPAKYALIVGISEFKNQKKYKLKTGKELNLKYAEKDASAIYSYLVDPEYAKFDKSNVVLLLNEDATTLNIQKALDHIKEEAGNEDEVLIYFSTHGTPSKFDGSMDIVTYDTDLKSINTSWQTALSAEHLKEFIRDTKAKKMVIVLDVCYSGAAFKNISGFYYAGAKGIDFEDDNQGISKKMMAKNLMGAKDIVFEDDVIEVSDASNKKSTKILISASDAGEKSWESDNLRGSVFTYYFLDGLKKRSQVRSAFDYSRPKVTSRVKEEKEAEQHPQVVSDKKEWDLSL